MKHAIALILGSLFAFWLFQVVLFIRLKVRWERREAAIARLEKCWAISKGKKHE